MLNLAQPFSVVTVGGTRHQLSIAMINVDFRAAPQCSPCLHVDWDEIDAIVKLVGGKPMLTAGAGLACLLKSSALLSLQVHDILDVAGDASLAVMCQRMDVSLAQTRSPAIDAAIAIAGIAAALLSGRASV